MKKKITERFYDSAGKLVRIESWEEYELERERKKKSDDKSDGAAQTE